MLNTPDETLIHIKLQTSDVVERYPPRSVVDAADVDFFGSKMAVPTHCFDMKPVPGFRSGRPSLPWIDFHVELARMYRDGEVPKKKEAAILYFQSWFSHNFGKKVSRSAIGEKLKPYFDKLGKQTEIDS